MAEDVEWRVVDSIGPPRIVLGRRVGNVFDLEVPREIHYDLVTTCFRYLYHNGNEVERADLSKWIKDWADVLGDD